MKGPFINLHKINATLLSSESVCVCVCVCVCVLGGHWRIPGGGAKDAPPPPLFNFLHFHVVFGKKCQIICFLVKTQGWAPPVWEILDPPQEGDPKRPQATVSFKKNSRKIWPLEVSTEICIRYRLSPLHYPISRSATGKCKRGILLKIINDCTIHKYRLLKH